MGKNIGQKLFSCILEFENDNAACIRACYSKNASSICTYFEKNSEVVFDIKSNFFGYCKHVMTLATLKILNFLGIKFCNFCDF